MQGATSTLPPRHATTTGDHTITFSAMATNVEVRVIDPGETANQQMGAVLELFREVEHACTRFDPSSPLMVANSSPDEWHEVPEVLLRAISAATIAHEATGGLFDPRVLGRLVDLGYDRSLPWDDGRVEVDRASTGEGAIPDGRWLPDIDRRHSAVRIGPTPIDLGGIGKGFAVTRAAELLHDSGAGYLVNAGGDIYVGGEGPDDGHWLVGVEDPAGSDDPVAVLQIRDRACATSSTRRRHWQVDGRAVHHLIDPRTGRSSESGLSSVTVLAADTTMAEVWSKTLFLVGGLGICAEATRRGLAALWIYDDGTVGRSPEMATHLFWEAPHVN